MDKQHPMKRVIVASIITIALLSFITLPGWNSASAKIITIGQSERNVTYHSVGGITLAGTLLIPAHPANKRVPGAIIIAGSGSVDRDGNEVQVGFVSNMYKQIADQLALQGIASLRYDKRGVGASTPFPLPKNLQQPTPDEIAALQNFVAWQNYVDDAVATLHYLQAQPEIVLDDTAIIGHSEGSIIASQIVGTQQKHSPSPRAIVLIGAPGRTLDVILREQIANGLNQLQTPDDATVFALQQYDALVAKVRLDGQVDENAIAALQGNTQVPTIITQTIAAIFSIYNVKTLRSEFQVNPAQLLPRYRGPVLILQGEDDQNVFATEDTPLLDAALKTRKHDDHQITIVPGANHELQQTLGGPLDPLAATTLRSWLAQKL
jgi:uncharacterized protein